MNEKVFTAIQEYHIKSEEHLFNCADGMLNVYNCDICNFQCDLKLDLLDHSVQVHNLAEIKTSVLKKFICKKCNFQTYSFLVFYKHYCKFWELKIEKAENLYFDPFTCASILELYKCRICDYCTNLKILLKRHANQVHKNGAFCDSFAAIDLQKKFTCVKCKLQTYSILVLFKHVCTPLKSRRNEKQTVVLQCEYCNFKTKWRPSLQRHLRLIHPPGKWYNCKHCDQTFPQIMDLESHLLKTHSAENLKPFHCKNCQYKTKDEDSLIRHMRVIHGIEMRFECEHCKTRFIRRTHLKRHIDQYHTVKNVKWYQCDFCEYTTRYSAHMKKHLLCRHANNHKIEFHQCTHCEYKTELKSSLIKHLELEHSLKTNFQWFNCVYCEHTFVLRSELKKHLAEQHSIVGKTGKRFLCEHCDYKTEYPNNLKAHMLRKHTDHQNINWIQCEHCEDKFVLKKDLDGHLLKVHSNVDEKWCHCDHCEYKTPFTWRLKDHILRKHTDHQNINWFQCEHCAFKTKMKTPLKLHMFRKHTPTEDIQWAKCHLCPYMGKHKFYLSRHMQAKHKDEAKSIETSAPS